MIPQPPTPSHLPHYHAMQILDTKYMEGNQLILIIYFDVMKVSKLKTRKMFENV